MIFTESTFEEANAGFESVGNPLRNQRTRFVACASNILASKVQIFQHVLDNYRTRIARSIKQFVIDSQWMVNPRHITEAYQLFIVKICPEKASQAQIIVADGFINSLARAILDKIVDITELAPTPTRADIRRIGAATDEIVVIRYSTVVAHRILAKTVVHGRQHVVKRVRISFQTLFVAENGLFIDRSLRNFIHRTSREEQAGKSERNY